jgi:two-component system sensor histidine kinase UhpB
MPLKTGSGFETDPIINILIVEDLPCDAELIKYEIRNGGIRFINLVVDNQDEYTRALTEFKPDIILSDYSLPQFDGLKALQIKNDLAPATPFILITGAMNEEIAVEVMKAGADDYMIKEHLKRLGPAILNAIEQGKLKQTKLAAELALKESEIHFRTLADCGQALIWITGIDGQVNYFNQPWLTFTGKPLQEQLGSGWTAGIHPNDLQHRMLTYTEKFEKCEKFSIKYRICHSSGEYRWIQDNGTPRYNSRGEFIGYMGHCLDITEQIVAEENIKRYNDQLRGLTAHLEQVREQERLALARDIHDVLGSSLSSLKMEMMILQKSIEAQYNTVQNGVDGRLQVMSGLIDNTINMMRKSVKELRPEILDELGLAEAVRWYAQEIEQRSGIEFVVTIFPKEIKMAFIKSIVLFRVFQEILTNIVQHSKATKATVFIKQTGETLLMKIADNGVGITQEMITRNDAFGILGMKERVLLLNGEIAITGKPGRGTTITLSVPA